MDHNEQRDHAEEQYNRRFCIPCGASPCTWDGNPDGFHTDGSSAPSGPAPLRAPPQPEMTAKQLARQLSRTGLPNSAEELLATSPGLRPHVARLAAGRCEDARRAGHSTAALDVLARRLRTWADEEETWQAHSIADAVIMLACAEHPNGICTAAIDLAAEAVLGTTAIARPMRGGLVTRVRQPRRPRRQPARKAS